MYYLLLLIFIFLLKKFECSSNHKHIMCTNSSIVFFILKPKPFLKIPKNCSVPRVKTLIIESSCPCLPIVLDRQYIRLGDYIEDLKLINFSILQIKHKALESITKLKEISANQIKSIFIEAYAFYGFQTNVNFKLQMSKMQKISIDWIGNDQLNIINVTANLSRKPDHKKQKRSRLKMALRSKISNFSKEIMYMHTAVLECRTSHVHLPSTRVTWDIPLNRSLYQFCNSTKVTSHNYLSITFPPFWIRTHIFIDANNSLRIENFRSSLNGQWKCILESTNVSLTTIVIFNLTTVTKIEKFYELTLICGFGTTGVMTIILLVTGVAFYWRDRNEVTELPASCHPPSPDLTLLPCLDIIYLHTPETSQ